MAEGAAGIHNNLEALRDRKGVSVLELWELFPDDDHAEDWLCWARWGGNIRCVDCGSEKIRISTHRQMRFRCNSSSSTCSTNASHTKTSDPNSSDSEASGSRAATRIPTEKLRRHQTRMSYFSGFRAVCGVSCSASGRCR